VLVLDRIIRLIASGTTLLHSRDNTSVKNEDKELEEILARKRSELLSTRIVNETRNHVVISTPVELTDSNFSQAVTRYPLLVVDFWAAWCGPCRLVSPVIEQLASEHAGKVVFGKVNVDENPLTAATFGIQSIPTITIFRDGSAVDGFIGVASKSQIQTKLSAHMQSQTRTRGP
jgi:thioredoxin 1